MKMNNEMISIIYGTLLVMMIAAAYLVAVDILLPENVIMIAVLTAASIAAIIAEFLYLNSRKKKERGFAAV